MTPTAHSVTAALPSMQAVPVVTAVADRGAASKKPPAERKTVTVNGKEYLVLKLIGRGGSCKVYRVLSEDNEVLALKRIALAESDHAVNFRREVELLVRLRGNSSIIKLVDYEERLQQESIFMLFEQGECDLAQVILRDRPLSTTTLRFYWQEMLKCVLVLHEQRILHMDLKPANFLFVSARLKIIDFGIAKAIDPHTVNIINDNTAGSINYMSPESICKMGPGSDQKIGRSSDVWSLGCILYHMVYGKPPFASVEGDVQKLYAITNPRVPIAYPANVPVDGALMDVMKSCLTRNPEKRPDIEKLMQHPFLTGPHQK
jgi:serine/threonine-protein kinase TTK/MPS1